MLEFRVIKAVYDTNVIVSGIISRGIPRLTLHLALSGRVKLFVSPALLEEYRQVLRRPIYQTIPNAQQILEAIERNSTVVFPFFTLNVALDPPDNRVVECADEAKAHYLVTDPFTFRPEKIGLGYGSIIKFEHLQLSNSASLSIKIKVSP